jgi:hypothetical protein
MAIRHTRARRARLAQLLIPFRRMYLSEDYGNPSFQPTLIEMHALTEGDDIVALEARVNLADYYQSIGKEENGIALLGPALESGSPPEVRCAADLMCGAHFLDSQPRRAAEFYHDAAINARDRGSYECAYEGFEMSIMLAGGIQEDVPSILVADIDQAATFWGANADLSIHKRTDIGLNKETSIGFAYPFTMERRPQTVVMGIIGDSTLYEKRIALWGNEPWEFVAPLQIATEGRVSHPEQPILDNWGNIVTFEI